MELAARVDQPLTDALAVQGYLALAGEPALGPVAFPHRFSAMAEPLAVIGHHWQDATHISHGVATLGVFTATPSSRARGSTGASPTRPAGTSTCAASTRGRDGSRSTRAPS